MDKTVVIGGHVQISQTIDGDAVLSNSIDGQFGTSYEVSRDIHETTAVNNAQLKERT